MVFEANMLVGDSNEVSFSKGVRSYALRDWVVYLSRAAAAQSSTVVRTSSCASVGVRVEIERDPWNRVRPMF